MKVANDLLTRQKCIVTDVVDRDLHADPAGDLRLGAYAIGGFAGALVVFWFLARTSVRMVSRLRGGGGLLGGWCRVSRRRSGRPL